MMRMVNDRRTFLGQGLLAAVAVARYPASATGASPQTARSAQAHSSAQVHSDAQTPRPPIPNRIGAQVYVFSQHHQRRGEQLRQHIPGMIEAHAAAGIRQLELMGDLVAPELRPALMQAATAHGVRFPVVYTGANLYARAEQPAALASALAVARNAAAVGARFLDCNPAPKPQKASKSDDELAIETEGIQKLARAVRAEGLTLLLHQHDAEMLENARNWRYWLRNTDPAEVRICFDTHWTHRAGQDVMTALRECRPRLECMHLRNSRQGVWWECLDDGDLDYRPVADFLRQTHYDGLLMVELAWEKDTRHTRSLTENLRLSRQYVERRFLG